MIFVSQNVVRKCKWCEKEPTKHFMKKKQKNGKRIFKGYYTTCGSPECLSQQYRDSHICQQKGILNIALKGICVLCKKEVKKISKPITRYCEECAPTIAWRERARRYGIGKKQWDKLLQQQNGLCALCDRNPEVVDHCHKEKIVRGLLCNRCNTRIQILEGDKEYLEKSMKYVGVNYSIS